MDSAEREREQTRYPRRAWNRSKSHVLIPKHTSLPNLHLQLQVVPRARASAGSPLPVRVLVPDSEHDSQSQSSPSSSPRVIHRRASAPASASVILDVQLASLQLPVHESQKYLFSQRVLRMGPHDPRPPSAIAFEGSDAERAFTSASTASSITYPMSSSSSHPHPSGRLSLSFSPQSQKQSHIPHSHFEPQPSDLFLDSKKSRPFLPASACVPVLSALPPDPPCALPGNARPPSVSFPTKNMREALEDQTHSENNDGLPTSESSSTKGNAISDSSPHPNGNDQNTRSRAGQRAKTKRLRRGVEVRGDVHVPTTTTHSAQTPAEESNADTIDSPSRTDTPTLTNIYAHAPSNPSSALPSEEPSAGPSTRSLSSSPHQPSPLPPSTSSSLLPMKSMKSFRTLRIKASRRVLTTDAENTSSKDDIPITQNTHTPPSASTSSSDERLRDSSQKGSKRSSNSPSQGLRPLTPDVDGEVDINASPAKQLRTLRRKKHFNILQSSSTSTHGTVVPAVLAESPKSEVQPIAITLNLRPSQRDLKSQPNSSSTPATSPTSSSTQTRPKSPLASSRSRSRPSSLSLSRPPSLTFPKRKPSRPLSIVATAVTVDEGESASGSSTGTASPPLTPTGPTHTVTQVVASVPTSPLVPPSTAPTGLVTSASPVSSPLPSSVTTSLTATASPLPSSLSSSPSPSPSPVKLGHPSRPYYSAIRKGVMGVGTIGGSPPSSRPTSFSGPSPSPSSSVPTASSALAFGSSSSTSVRPKSYTPPSTTFLNHFTPASNSSSGSTSASVASRHLSMSSLFIGTPPHTSPFSAFAVLDDEEEEEEADSTTDAVVEDPVQLSTPTPMPTPSQGLLSFSLSAASRRLSGGRGHGHGLGQGQGHRKTMSLSTSPSSSSSSQAHTTTTISANATSNANANANQASRHRNTIGFSMSGETELRMALAAAASAAAASEGATELGAGASGRAGPSAGFAFKFRERASLPPPPSSVESTDSGIPPDDADADAELRFWRMRTRSPPPPGLALGVQRIALAPARDSPSHSSNSFIGRVRKLRKGLKEMMLLG